MYLSHSNGFSSYSKWNPDSLPKTASICMHALAWPTLGNLHYNLITRAFLFFTQDKAIPALRLCSYSSLFRLHSPPRFLHGWLSFFHAHSCLNSNLTSLRRTFPIRSGYLGYPPLPPSPSHSFIALITPCSWVMHCFIDLFTLCLLNRMKPVLPGWYCKYLTTSITWYLSIRIDTYQSPGTGTRRHLYLPFNPLSCWFWGRSRSPEGGVGVTRTIHVN